MIARSPWTHVLDKAPPYDTIVLVRGTVKWSGTAGIWKDGEIVEEYREGECKEVALAFNQCYPPDMCMCQVVEGDDDFPFEYTNPEIPWEIEEWMEIPE